MKKLPKVGDVVRLKKSTISFANVKPGETGIVTAVTPEKNRFSVNGVGWCHIKYWINETSLARKKKRRYIISSTILEALNGKTEMGDEIEVEVVV